MSEIWLYLLRTKTKNNAVTQPPFKFALQRQTVTDLLVGTPSPGTGHSATDLIRLHLKESGDKSQWAT